MRQNRELENFAAKITNALCSTKLHFILEGFPDGESARKHHP